MEDTAKKPRRSPPRDYPLEMAIALGASRDVVEALCDAHPEAVGGSDSFASTLLHLAVERGAPADTVALLIERHPLAVGLGKGHRRLTPLHLACSAGASLEVLRLLVESGPGALGERDSVGRTPLHYACIANASSEAVELLVRSRPESVREEDVDGKTPVECACFGGSRPEVLWVLLERHPEAVLTKDRFGWTMLHRACANRAPGEVIQLLLERNVGALMDEDTDGNTPVALTMEPEVSDMLRNLCAAMDVETNDEEVMDVIFKFGDMEWWGGVVLIVDARPSILHSLKVADEVMPEALHKIGRECELRTMWELIRGRPSLFHNVIKEGGMD